MKAFNIPNFLFEEHNKLIENPDIAASNHHEVFTHETHAITDHQMINDILGIDDIYNIDYAKRLVIGPKHLGLYDCYYKSRWGDYLVCRQIQHNHIRKIKFNYKRNFRIRYINRKGTTKHISIKCGDVKIYTERNLEYKYYRLHNNNDSNVIVSFNHIENNKISVAIFDREKPFRLHNISLQRLHHILKIKKLRQSATITTAGVASEPASGQPPLCYCCESGSSSQSRIHSGYRERCTGIIYWWYADNHCVPNTNEFWEIGTFNFRTGRYTKRFGRNLKAGSVPNLDHDAVTQYLVNKYASRYSNYNKSFFTFGPNFIGINMKIKKIYTSGSYKYFEVEYVPGWITYPKELAHNWITFDIF